MTTWSINVSIEPSGDLAWAGSDGGPHSAHLAAFAEAHGIETTFSSWTTTDWS